MLKVYIADDEEVVRQGLKKIINWQALGFEICGEAGNGLSAYNEISELSPDLILIDIRMPKMHGLDLASHLRKDGYTGHIIVLSGYSEFKYAQEAIKCDVDFYLTKPIEEDELYNSVLNIKNLIHEKRTQFEHMFYYQEKATDKIFEDIIKGEASNIDKTHYSLEDLDLTADQYQILILQSSEKDLDSYISLCQSLKLPYTTNLMKNTHINNNQVVLLIGALVIGRLKAYKNNLSIITSDSLFIAQGPVVSSVESINSSYKVALSLSARQFFLQKNKRIAEKSDLIDESKLTYSFTAQNSKELGQQLYDLIVIFKKSECELFLDRLKENLLNSKNSAESVKSVLAGMYIYIVQEFKRTYSNYKPEFLTNAEIIQWFHSCIYLQDIIDYLNIEAKRLIQIIGGYSGESIVDEIVEFVKYHFDEDIKLKTLAPKFGYNSSYLGKIFSKKLGVGFNDYLHKIRTEKAKEYLLNKKYKIYEISSLVGYKNVDYFHLKFKQYEGKTPNEYRTAHHIEVE